MEWTLLMGINLSPELCYFEILHDDVTPWSTTIYSLRNVVHSSHSQHYWYPISVMQLTWVTLLFSAFLNCHVPLCALHKKAAFSVDISYLLTHPVRCRWCRYLISSCHLKTWRPFRNWTKTCALLPQQLSGTGTITATLICHAFRYLFLTKNELLFITSAKEVMFLPDFVCLFLCLFQIVCLCVSKITHKVMDGSFWNFLGMSGMAKTTSGSILGVIQKASWILDNFEIFVTIAFNGT